MVDGYEGLGNSFEIVLPSICFELRQQDLDQLSLQPSPLRVSLKLVRVRLYIPKGRSSDYNGRFVWVKTRNHHFNNQHSIIKEFPEGLL